MSLERLELSASARAELAEKGLADQPHPALPRRLRRVGSDMAVGAPRPRARTRHKRGFWPTKGAPGVLRVA
jgi:hypothetical protein